MKTIFSILLVGVMVGCSTGADSTAGDGASESDSPAVAKPAGNPIAGTPDRPKLRRLPRTARTIHVFVALCDNESQEIVPVSKLLGDGDDPRNNLYWGAMYGTKTFLKRSGAWDVVPTTGQVTPPVLERLVLKHRATGAYLVADAYRGSEIKRAIKAFINAAAGKKLTVLKAGGSVLGTHGMANLVAYIGHNGLMEFSMTAPASRDNSAPAPAAIVLACKSRPYFQPVLARLQCTPLLLTTGLMAPEAYTLQAALEAWLAGRGAAGMRIAAASAYNKYQKCGTRAAKRLFGAE